MVRLKDIAAQAGVSVMTVSKALRDAPDISPATKARLRALAEHMGYMPDSAALGDTWQDQEHVKFSEEFKQTLKALKKFVEISNQHTPYLLRKAQRIEEYLNQR